MRTRTARDFVVVLNILTAFGQPVYDRRHDAFERAIERMKQNRLQKLKVHEDSPGMHKVQELLGLLGPSLGIQNWTVSDTMMAAKAAYSCARVPKQVSSDFKAKCTGGDGFAKSAGVKMVNALMIAKQLQHINNLRVHELAEAFAPYATQFLTSHVRKQTQAFCSHGNCQENADELWQSMTTCEAAYTCGNMLTNSPNLPPVFTSFSTCTQLISKVVSAYFSLTKPECDREPSTGVYCAEMVEDLLLDDFQCYMEMISFGLTRPSGMCDDKCNAVVTGLKAKYPTCMRIFEDKVAHVQASLTDISHKLFPDQKQPGAIPAIPCHDLRTLRQSWTHHDGEYINV